MRSNTRQNQLEGNSVKTMINKVSTKIRNLTGRKSLRSQKSNLRQLMAMFVICLMLLPIFSLPVSAANVWSLPLDNGADYSKFEPVNPHPIWEKAAIEVNLAAERWMNVPNEPNIISSGETLEEMVIESGENKNAVKTEEERAAPDPEETKGGNGQIKDGDDVKTDAVKTEENTDSSASIETITDSSDDSASPESSLKNKTKSAPVSSTNLVNQLPDNERDTIYNYENNLGAPPGQVETDSSNEAAALRVRHRPGIANFSFGLPLAGLSGRGMDAGVGLTYNSRTWNKSVTTDPNNPNLTVDHFTYDVEQSWLAPGFSTGFGYLETTATVSYNHPHQSSNFKYFTEFVPKGMTDADGTRRQFGCASFMPIPDTYSYQCNEYRSSDGSFISTPTNGRKPHTPSSSQTLNLTGYEDAKFVLSYPNGMIIEYSGGFGSGTTRRHYPLKIRDRNGNIMRIAYRGQTGRIDFITDTLGRKIKFYYETDVYGNPEELVAVTIPGMTTDSEIQTVRFYYEDMPLNSTGGYIGQVTAPANVKVLKYVYMPGTKTGYKYDYHPKYGMIKKISRMVGLNASTTETNTTGTIDGGIVAASTEYLYPDGNTALDDVPKYNSRLDDWAGRTGTAPQETIYEEPEANAQGEMVSTITVKDNGFDVVTENISHYTGDWKNGLVKKTRIVKKGGSFETQMAATEYFWKLGQVYIIGSRGNPVLEKIETTNEAGLTKATKFFYDQYNNQTKIEEYDYKSGTNESLLRTTEIEYETGTGWIAARHFNLTKSVKVIVNGQTVSKTLYEYDHNGSDAELLGYADMSSSTHDPSFNKANPPRTCQRSCEELPLGATIEPEDEAHPCPLICTGSYLSSTRFRGNLTRVARMIDPNATEITESNSNENNYGYDIAGNLVSASLSCCNVKMINYGSSYSETGYAFPVSETKGSSPQLTTSATYNYNTGLPLTSTNENGQPTEYQYEQDTLRQKKVIYSNTAYTETEYSDKLAAGPQDLLPGFVRTTSKIDTNKTIQSYSYYDGRGLGIQSATETPDGMWSISAVKYDQLGRPVKSYNPYYGTTPTAAPGNAKYTEVLGYDAFGRTTSVKLQDETIVSTQFSDLTTTPAGFNKTFVTVTDQAGKQRRQISDSLGRIVRVDEPDINGDLGLVTAPAQPTAYEYDANDNLAKITQTDGPVVQERLFKYDALSRLTHERQVEAIPTLSNDGTPGSPGSNNWTKVLKYNQDGLLKEAIDARGVKTAFTYDGINRVESVTYTGETGYQTPNVTYTYDEARPNSYNTGALTKVATAATANAPATATEFDYDQMGRVKHHRQSIGTQVYPMEYGYNLAGQLTSQKYPSGKIVSIGYDSKGRLSTIADQSRTYLNNLQFQGNGNSLSAMSFGNGTTQNFVMNDRLQMTGQELKRGTEVLQKYDYGYGQIDQNGNLDITKNNGQIARVESHIGTAKQWTQKFSYDSLGRLAEAKEYRGDTNALSYKQKFDFDKFGNLYRKNASNSVAGQETPLAFTPIEDADINKANNRFATQTTYDNAGNVITDNKFREMNYGYDANGRMVKATRANVPDAASVYDASGMRVAEKVNDVWKFFIFDIGGKLIAEYGGLQAMNEGGVKYLFADWQGSTRAIVSQGGYVQARLDYSAFGEDISAGTGIRTTAQGFNASNNLRQRYGLTERDEATGLDHTWFRKNENRAGRWTSPDPYKGSMSLGNPQSFNRYSYVENQPTNFIDPSGLLKEGDPCTVTLADGTKIPGRADKWGGCNPYTGTFDGGTVYGSTPSVDWTNGSPTTSVSVRTGNSYGDWIDIVLSGTGLTNVDKENIKLQDKLNKSRKEEEERKRRKFQECLKSELADAVSGVRKILLGGGVTTAGASIGTSGLDLGGFGSQGKRFFVLYGTYKYLQNEEPGFENARSKAIVDCRGQSGYDGPLDGDNRSWFFKPASSFLK